MTFPFKTVTATGDHGSITFRKSDGVVVARGFDSGYENDPNAGYPFILWANPDTLTNDPMDVLHVGYYFQMPGGALCYEPPIEDADLAPPLPKTEPKSMKPFDLAKAKAGAPVITRNGCTARIICFDRADDDGYSLVALLQLDKGIERVTTHTDQGRYCKEPGNDYDLFMAPVKREGWVNIYRSAPGGAQDCYPQPLIFNTREEAIAAAYPSSLRATTRIEWEE